MIFLCVALVGASISSSAVTVESSLWWRASTRAAAAGHRLSTLGVQVKPDSQKQSLICCFCVSWFRFKVIVFYFICVFSLEKGLSPSAVPPAPALLLAASLHRAWRGQRGDNQSFSAALNMLRPDRGVQHRQVRVKNFPTSCYHQVETFVYILKVRIYCW